jgi:hypothetical protein
MKITSKLFIGVTFLILASCNQPDGNPQNNAASKPAESKIVVKESAPSSGSAVALPSEKPDQSRLIGEWERSDGGYLLKIISATTDGKLDAGYFNPKSINVARAEWVVKDNKLMVGVELRDVNYPGSTYMLEYFPKEEKLVGNYYQAVEGVNYEVEFVKKK